jgi:hypothetical protein
MYYWISNQRLRVSQFNVFESKSMLKSNNCFKTLYCPKNISSFSTLEVFLCLKCFSVGIQIQTGKIFVTLYWHFDVTTLRRWRWSWKRRKLKKWKHARVLVGLSERCNCWKVHVTMYFMHSMNNTKRR